MSLPQEIQDLLYNFSLALIQWHTFSLFIVELRAKKVVLFLEVKCVSKYIYTFNFFNFKKKLRRQKNTHTHTHTHTQETKEEKRISAENLTGYNDIVCEFALSNFNLLVYVQREKSQYLLYCNNK